MNNTSIVTQVIIAVAGVLTPIFVCILQILLKSTFRIKVYSKH